MDGRNHSSRAPFHDLWPRLFVSKILVDDLLGGSHGDVEVFELLGRHVNHLINLGVLWRHSRETHGKRNRSHTGLIS